MKKIYTEQILLRMKKGTRAKLKKISKKRGVSEKIREILEEKLSTVKGLQVDIQVI